jgi:hypothetical protein
MCGLAFRQTSSQARGVAKQGLPRVSPSFIISTTHGQSALLFAARRQWLYTPLMATFINFQPTESSLTT